MADRRILETITRGTADFKAGLKDQLKTLKTLSDMGETLKELTDDDDPVQESIKGTMKAIEDIVNVVDNLTKLPIPKI